MAGQETVANTEQALRPLPLFCCLRPLLSPPSNLVQGVKMSTRAYKLIRFSAQMPLLSVSLSTFSLLPTQRSLCWGHITKDSQRAQSTTGRTQAGLPSPRSAVTEWPPLARNHRRAEAVGSRSDHLHHHQTNPSSLRHAHHPPLPQPPWPQRHPHHPPHRGLLGPALPSAGR